MARTLLLAADTGNSILVELGGGEPNSLAYSAYGGQSAPRAIASHLGFNGELSERQIGWYLLGKGYRAYNPVLMRFLKPDRLSPFGKGGLNAYMYCRGDPLNFLDPTGKLNIPKLLGFQNLPRTGSSVALISNAAPMASSSQNALQQTLPALTRKTVTETVSATYIKTEVTVALNGFRRGKRAPPHIETRNHVRNWDASVATSDQRTIDYGPWPATPQQRPSKTMVGNPKFNDTGGQVTDHKGEVLVRKPFEFPTGDPPLPATRTRPDGVKLQYSMTRYAGRLTLESRRLKSLPPRQGAIREPGNV
ncbi:RHS repeat-associated core domain-containing protein [Pseudomonas sp. 14P_8.1_Bac3]|uniref:RHS repeat-associated core domain-containing protein n=1 Tax=Pseudomonas sp. 14P_8.1_Bac3 TaxID=2971621 RepID=UPI0021C93B4F|nr:RHS repeat-associated core domain-containing protein [Pseudomonas sp. 14P_8.1_Bac3]MCU1763792.1 RHS repeat-associated core domain-containing protein [Pseudomonas sp. 14P_8.1_Bac3]